MPIKKAAMKALRKAEKNLRRNKIIKNSIQILIRRSERAIIEKKIEDAKNLIKLASKAVDKAVKSKIVKQNTASRLKSRLMARLRNIAKK